MWTWTSLLSTVGIVFEKEQKYFSFLDILTKTNQNESNSFTFQNEQTEFNAIVPIIKTNRIKRIHSFKIVCFEKQNKCIRLSLFLLKSKTIAFVVVCFSQNIQKQTIFWFVFKNDSNSTVHCGALLSMPILWCLKLP